MRIDQLTFSRFIAATAIVIFHYGADAFPFNNSNISFLVSEANIGVSYFFVLSGFIMVVAYHGFSSISPLKYWLNRFARIYPLLVLSVLPVLLGGIMGFGNNNIADGLLNLLCIQAWIPEKALAGNGPAWSISVEVLFYLCFPFIFDHIYKRIKLKRLLIITIIFWIASLIIQYYVLKHGHSRLRFFPLLHLNQFLAGNLAGLFFMANSGKNSRMQLDIFVIAAVAVMVVLIKFPLRINYHTGFMVIVFAPLILLQAFNGGIFTWIARLRPLVFLGEISFGIYILQYPVYQITKIGMEKLGFTLSGSSGFYSYFAILIACSAASHIFVENPLRNRIKTLKLKP